MNAIAFLATHSTIERETKEMGEVREHILLLVAAHPNTPMNATEQKLVENFRRSQAKTWDLLASPDHTPLDAWDVDMRTWTEPRCEEEMTRLGTQSTRCNRNRCSADMLFIDLDVSPSVI